MAIPCVSSHLATCAPFTIPKRHLLEENSFLPLVSGTFFFLASCFFSFFYALYFRRKHLDEKEWSLKKNLGCCRLQRPLVFSGVFLSHRKPGWSLHKITLSSNQQPSPIPTTITQQTRKTPSPGMEVPCTKAVSSGKQRQVHSVCKTFHIE